MRRLRYRWSLALTMAMAVAGSLAIAEPALASVKSFFPQNTKAGGSAYVSFGYGVVGDKPLVGA